MKDNFSSQSDKYAKYRPKNPTEFFDYLNRVIPNKVTAWDCGTGNGQVALELAKNFDQVHATDISQQQLNNAISAHNISYSLQPAENTSFDDDTFDLIIVAQAIHWFDFEKFYSEARRTGKKSAKLCALGYGRIQISPEIDPIITDFYKNTIGSYWDTERKYIDDGYATIPFPFKEIQTPSFVNQQRWTLERLIGYLNTWSAVKHFVQENGFNPVIELTKQLSRNWNKEESKLVKFPILLRLGELASTLTT